MNALEPITGAYRKAGIISEVEAPSAEQGAWGVTRLNRMMAALREDGIDLGYTEASNTASTIVLPDGHMEAIEALLAVKLHGDTFATTPPADLAAEASAGLQRLQRQAVLLQNTAISMRHISGGAGSSIPYNIVTGS